MMFYLAYLFLLFAPLFCDIHEKRLYDKLISDYNVLERPVENSSHPIIVFMKLTLQQIIDVDEKNQLIQTNSWLEYNWVDYRLQWEPKDYGNVTDLRFPSDRLWKPDILLYNSVDSNFDSTYHSNVVVYSNGKIVWIPPGNLRSSCNIDIKWFPFDDQKCYLKFGSWTYNGFKLDLREMSKNIDISEYIENGEWALIDVPVERNVRRYHYDSAPEEFIDLKFYLHLRRRTLYYAFNMIVPSLVILLMTILGFALPVESGEKVTLEITILLSICVFLNMASQMIPSTSEAVPLIVVFFTCNMMIVAFSVVFNVFILSLHYRTPDTHTMSKWMEIMLLNWLPWFLRMKRPGHKFSKDSLCVYLKRKWREFRYDQKKRNIQKCQENANFPLKKWSFCLECEKLQKNDRIDDRNNDRDIWPLMESTSSSFNSMIESLTRIHNSLLFITERLQKDEDEQEAKNDWKFAAMVIDRFCLYIFSAMIIICSCAILFSSPHLGA